MADTKAPLDWSSARVIVTGGAGFLGRSVVRVLRERGASRVMVPRSAQFDLTQPAGAAAMYAAAARALGGPPTHVIHCAGFVGGIGANRAWPARMLHDNLAMGVNVVEAARAAGLVGPGPEHVHVTLVSTMCIYPADAPLPFSEAHIFGGPPDAEIAPYGLGKRLLLTMLHAYRAQHGLKGAYVIPVNLFGPGDNVDDERRSHVAGALLRRFVDAAAAREPEVACWGSGAPTRDFIYVDDAAEGLVRCAELVDDATPINIASGQETSIRDLATLIARAAGFSGRIAWDTSKGDGVARRCLDIARARERLGWSPRIGLEEGMRRTVEWYRERRA